MSHKGNMSTKSRLPRVKDFDKEWTAEDWSHWAFMVGHKLDLWIPWCGVDNRQRIEDAIFEWEKLKRVA